MSSNDSKDRASLCAFAYSDGRNCRMLRSSRNSKYCLHHERKLRHLKEADDAAADLFDPISGGFVTATALTQSMSRLFAAVAEGRIDPKNATALARVADTLLKSISLSTDEFRGSFRESYWMQLVRESCGDLPEYIPPVPRHPRPAPAPAPPSDDSSGDSKSSKNIADSSNGEGLC